MLLLLGAVSCGDDSTKTGKEGTGITNAEWSSTENCAAEGETLNFTFTADDTWTATSAKSWCKVLTPSGTEGAATLTLEVEPNSTGSLRKATVSVKVSGYGAKRVITVSQPSAGGTTGSGAYASLNKKVDNYLVERYLWNDEYKTMLRDVSIPYVDVSDNFVKTTLLRMTTNTLDKKNGNVYSYLHLVSGAGVSSAESRAGFFTDRPSSLKKQQVASFGFDQMDYAYLVDDQGERTGEWVFFPAAVYPESPADKAGFKRGSSIYKVNGEVLTDANVNTYYSLLLEPSASQSVTLTEYRSGAQPVSVGATNLYPNPVVYSDILTEGGKKIGYLVYTGFDAAYDEELMGVIKSFKDAAIDELILDLRYNGGGYVITSRMLASCIAGVSKCRNQVYHYYRYNDSRMANHSIAPTGQSYDSSAGKFYENFYTSYYGVNLADYSLDLNKVYIICTGSTASASEWTPWSLQGLGIGTVFIGQKTSGKNVGMEVTDITDNGSTYEFAPITFQGYNKKMETIPSSGIVPGAANTVNEFNNGLTAFGKTEPMLAKALSVITGTTYPTAKTRSDVGFIQAQIAEKPEVSRRISGALLLPDAEEAE